MVAPLCALIIQLLFNAARGAIVQLAEHIFKEVTESKPGSEALKDVNALVTQAKSFMNVVVEEFAFLKPIIAIVVNLLPDLLKGLVPKTEASLATCAELLLMSWTVLAEKLAAAVARECPGDAGTLVDAAGKLKIPDWLTDTSNDALLNSMLQLPKVGQEAAQRIKQAASKDE